ncbi:MAG TPA: 4'-phosphopantetheinyl transferase superfamily protein [Solirubrobacteraceae bacterium]|jgi:4'-phosphopantetheinyl transferase
MRASPPAPSQLYVDAAAASSLGPRHPRLAPGELHVWVADLSPVDDSTCRLLDDAELERARRIVGERERIAWQRSRASLRQLLARYLGVGERFLQLDAGAGGKPMLRSERAPYFNLSHSGDVAVYALAMYPVGVDVEVMRRADAARRRDHAALARRAFGLPVAERLTGLDEDTQEREFLRHWTRHEAALKLAGGGIGATVDRAPADPWIAELDLGSTIVAAVASARPADTLRVWRLA